MTRTTASAVAEWLVAWHNEHGEQPITNLRLQKLMYYAQAWRLALADEALFPEDFQAWMHGPVIPAIYGQFKKYGGGPIPATPWAVAEDGEPSYLRPDFFGEETGVVENHLRDVMEAYSPASTWQLEQLTHQEAPWINARGGLAPDATCKAVIQKETMRTFYKGLLNAQSQAKR